MKNYVANIIMTQLSMFVLILLIMKNKTLKKSAKKGIVITSFMIMICSLSEFMGILLDGKGSSLRILHIAVKFTEFSLAPIIPVAFSTAFYPIKSKKLVFIPNAINIALVILSLFFGFIFNVDGDNFYHHGRLYYLYYFFISLGVIFLVCTAVRFGAHFQNRNNLSLGMILIFVFEGAVCQAADSSLKIVWLTVAIGMILFYIYYCNMILQIDALTELLNRRSYDSRIGYQHRRAVILYFDINNFKSINDNYGHNTGDLCLQTVARVLKEVYGRRGLCYRIGGDEFCVIIDRRTDLVDVEKLNERFGNTLFESEKDGKIGTTVAIGYAVFEPSSMKFADAIAIADSRMYLNKSSK